MAVRIRPCFPRMVESFYVSSGTPLQKKESMGVPFQGMAAGEDGSVPDGGNLHH